MREIIPIPVEVEIDDNSILEQINQVEKAMWKLDKELSKLMRLLMGARTKGQGDPEGCESDEQ